MKVLPGQLVEIKNALFNSGAWIRLYTLDVNDTLRIRVTDNSEPVTFDGQTYQPYPVSFEQLRETGDGQLPVYTIAVSNVTREVTALLERYDGFRGRSVRIQFVNSEYLSDPTANVGFLGRVKSVTVDANAAAFEIGSDEFLDLRFPFHSFNVTTCRHEFGGPRCRWGFPARPPGVPPSFSCTKVLNGPNGCRAHGDLYEQVGVPREHPQRFGGFPLTPQRRGG